MTGYMGSAPLRRVVERTVVSGSGRRLVQRELLECGHRNVGDGHHPKRRRCVECARPAPERTLEERNGTDDEDRP